MKRASAAPPEWWAERVIRGATGVAHDRRIAAGRCR